MWGLLALALLTLAFFITTVICFVKWQNVKDDYKILQLKVKSFADKVESANKTHQEFVQKVATIATRAQQPTPDRSLN